MELELVGCFRGKNQNGSCDINIEGEAVARLAPVPQNCSLDLEYESDLFIC